MHCYADYMLYICICVAYAMGAMYIANHFNIRAIAALTESGSTALLMSRISSGIPIYAITPHEKTRQKVTLYRGVYPMAFEYEGLDNDDVVPNMIEELKRTGQVKDGDKVLVTRGKHRGIMGGTNVLLIVEVGEWVKFLIFLLTNLED